MNRASFEVYVEYEPAPALKPGQIVRRGLEPMAALRGNKCETSDCLKFTLEGAEERSDGNARKPAQPFAFVA